MKCRPKGEHWRASSSPQRTPARSIRDGDGQTLTSVMFTQTGKVWKAPRSVLVVQLNDGKRAFSSHTSAFTITNQKRPRNILTSKQSLLFVQRRLRRPVTSCASSVRFPGAPLLSSSAPPRTAPPRPAPPRAEVWVTPDWPRVCNMKSIRSISEDHCPAGSHSYFSDDGGKTIMFWRDSYGELCFHKRKNQCSSDFSFNGTKRKFMSPHQTNTLTSSYQKLCFDLRLSGTSCLFKAPVARS